MSIVIVCYQGKPDYEDCIVCPLAAENIRRVIRFPDPDFLILTGCAGLARRGGWPVAKSERSPGEAGCSNRVPGAGFEPARGCPQGILSP